MSSYNIGNQQTYQAARILGAIDHNGAMSSNYLGSALRFSDEDRSFARTASYVLAQVIPTLAQTLGPRTEVLVHDLTLAPATIVAIAQPITGRDVGGPPTDLSLMMLASQRGEGLVGYASTFNGQTLRSTSAFIRTPSGQAVVALCINADVDDLTKAREALEHLTSMTPLFFEGADQPLPTETFPSSVESLTDGMIREQIASVGVPVELMKKKHKLDVVRRLRARGFFELKESVDLCAKALDVTRYTIYNYLNQISQEEEDSGTDADLEQNVG